MVQRHLVRLSTINPEKFFTPEIMEQLDAVASKEFKYGQRVEEIEVEEETEQD
jgi:hypothetical protein